MNTTRTAYNAARAKMTRFVASESKADLADLATIIYGHIVIGGRPSECEKVRAHFANVLGVKGVTVDTVLADDPDWTCVRIPEAECTARLQTLETKRAAIRAGGTRTWR